MTGQQLWVEDGDQIGQHEIGVSHGTFVLVVTTIGILFFVVVPNIAIFEGSKIAIAGVGGL